MTETKPSFADKFLPTQPEHRNHFKDPEETYVAALYDLVVRASGLMLPDQEFEIESDPGLTLPEMASSPWLLRFLQLLIGISGAKRVLEIGTFVGVSTLYLAKALPPDGQIMAIEKFDRFAEIAQRNFKSNNASDHITLIHADALEFLRDWERDVESVDFVFLDGDKSHYPEYFAALDPLIAPGGLLVADDVFFHGDAANARPMSEKGRGTRRFLEIMEPRDDYLKLLLPVCNGVFVARKRDNRARPY